MTTRAEKIEKLAEIIEREPAPPPPAPGSILWTPCLGLKAKKDHTGEIRVAVGQGGGRVKWQGTGEWIGFKAAQKKHPEIIQDTQRSLCPRCRTK